MHRVPLRRAAARAASAVVPLVLLPALLAAPASAHDELLSVTPTKDAVLTAAPTEVQLTFSEEVESLGAAVVATGSDGTPLSDGAPVVDGPTVTQKLLPVTAATTVTVKYRIVSSDGHPVSGSWSFEVDLPASLPLASPTASPSGTATATATVTASASAAATASASASARPSDIAASPAGSTSDDGGGISPLIWVAIGAALVAVVVALLPGRGRAGKAD